MRIRLPRREKNKVKTYKQTVVNAVILVVILSVFLYVAIQISQNFSTQVSTQRTQMITDVAYAYLDGCIFKDGAVLTVSGDIVHYLVPDGAKVGVGQAYAEVYSSTSISAGDRAATEQRLNELSERILMLEAGLAGGKSTSDLGNIGNDIADNYYAYIDGVLSGDIPVADRSGEALLGGLVDHSAITLSQEAQNTLETLKAERDSLIASIGGTKTVLVSDRSFTLYRDTDGYESILHTSLVGELDRDKLDALMTQDGAADGGAIGSMIYSAKWYIAIPTDEAGYETFKHNVGKTYEVEIIGADGLTISMLLESVVAESAGGAGSVGDEAARDEDETRTPEDEDINSSRTYLLFSSFDLARISGLDRHQSVRVKLGSTTGYRIPRDALHTLGDDRGVYVLIGNMIEFRRITIIGEGDGYYVVSTYERDLSDSATSEIPYLNINDLIVTSGRDLYDGKLLD